MNNFYEGQWLLCNDPERGEMFRGYIVEDGIDPRGTSVCIMIMESESGTKIGKEKYFKQRDCKPLELDEALLYMEEGSVLNMIDYALLVRDKDLFMKMTERLQEMRRKHNDDESQTKIRSPR